MNPTLLSITGIEYSEKFKDILQGLSSNMILNPPDLLLSPVPKGIPIDLKDGILRDELTYETKDGILIKGSSVNNLLYEKTPLGGEDFRTSILCAFSDSNDFFRPAGKGEIEFIFQNLRCCQVFWFQVLTGTRERVKIFHHRSSDLYFMFVLMAPILKNIRKFSITRQRRKDRSGWVFPKYR